MELQHHRKLMHDSFISSVCKPICNMTSYCDPECFTYCPPKCSCTDKCLTDMFNDNPVLSPPIYQDGHSDKSHRAPKSLVISLVVVCTVFLVVSLCAVYYRFYGNRRTNRQSNETRNDFLDEGQGPILDHPIWYIRTTGLQPSIISSITVLKYQKGEGLIEGTDCSVCLSEFHEDETLRLLPKCSHAFHLPCIDTWLRSHTNCPLCRAPIITAGTTVRTAEHPEINIVNLGSVGERQVGHVDRTGESDNGETVDGARELRVEGEGEGESTTVQSGIKTCESSNRGIEIEALPRRSISLDSISAAKINFDLCNGFHSEIREDFGGMGEVNARTTIKGSSSMSKDSSNRPISLKRSFSYSGILMLSRHSRSQKTKAPIRSF